MSDWFDVAQIEDFGPGETRLVDVEDVMIAVFNIEGEYFAMEDVCTHEGLSFLDCGVEPEVIINGDEITCPHHGARFCIKSGMALSPPAYDPVVTFPVRVESGTVQVMDDRD